MGNLTYIQMTPPEGWCKSQGPGSQDCGTTRAVHRTHARMLEGVFLLHSRRYCVQGGQSRGFYYYYYYYYFIGKADIQRGETERKIFIR